MNGPVSRRSSTSAGVSLRGERTHGRRRAVHRRGDVAPRLWAVCTAGGVRRRAGARRAGTHGGWVCRAARAQPAKRIRDRQVEAVDEDHRHELHEVAACVDPLGGRVLRPRLALLAILLVEQEVLQRVAGHERVGRHHLRMGVGWEGGGSCFWQGRDVGAAREGETRACEGGRSV